MKAKVEHVEHWPRTTLARDRERRRVPITHKMLAIDRKLPVNGRVERELSFGCPKERQILCS